MRFDERIIQYTSVINERFPQLLPNNGKVSRAMLYSLEAGGKRIRPMLTLEFCRVCGGNFMNALDTACAVEMIHTFSLIHDDLPCMDDDDMRRGRPSCHKTFGEATALLAGDALAVLPFEIISASAGKGDISPEKALKIIGILSSAVGTAGMIGGQEIDTLYQGKEIDIELLLEMYRMKTSELLRAACCCGCVAGGADDTQLELAEKYALQLGLAFQIIDDILDIKGNSAILGKPTGSDAEKNKPTYASLFGIEKSEETARVLTENALTTARSFPDSDFLCQLTEMLLKRNK